MAKIQVPFEVAEETGVFLEIDVPEKNLAYSFIPKETAALPNVGAATAYAVEHPLGSKPLSRMLRKGDRVTIITENQFRAAPADLILPPLLQAIRAAGAIPAIAVGCGKVPPLTADELDRKLGKEVVESGIEIVCNDVSKPELYRYVGTTSHGIPLFVLKLVADADVKIAVGTTQATLWGYGGSGMILPAVSGNETIELNHVFSLADECRPGNNDCLMQRDKYEAARKVGIDMGIQVIVNNRFEVTYVGAGDFVQSHQAAVKAYDEVYRFAAGCCTGAPVDIVITGSSAPTNHLFFHTGWSVVNCDPICKDGGTIIQATPCPGYGSWPGFALMDLMQAYMPPSVENQAKALQAFYHKERELWAGCIWYKIYEVMTRKHVTIVTNKENLQLAAQAGVPATASLQEAFEEALQRHGPNARVAFVPFGRYTVLDV